MYRVGEPYSVPAAFGENRCFGGDCRVDTDCGRGGYCSPSNHPCGTSWGYYDFRCHTAFDECTDDEDCANVDAGPGPIVPHFCAYNSPKGRWTCFQGINNCHDA
jgi:hypothetical protein